MAEQVTSAVKRAPRKKPSLVAGAAVEAVAEATTEVAAKVQAEAEALPAKAAKVAEEIEAVASPAVEETVKTLAEPATAASLEGQQSMATVEFGAADKAQAVFGDMQQRFKAAWDKSSKLGEEMVDFAKGNVEAVVASARVAAKHGEELGQEAADYTKKNFENAVAAFRSVASAKSPTELFQLQSDFAKSSFDSAVAEASKVSERILKIAGDVAQPLSNRYAVAAEKIKSTTTF